MNAPRVSLKPVKGDLDGFFGLAVDNLVQVLVIVALCTKICGFSESLIYTRVLPGIAVSLLIGNIYYALHAMWVAKRDANPTCTALPYGINTPSVFAYILFILAPVYGRYSPEIGPEAAGDLAWKLGLLACIGSGIIEFLGAFIGGWVRRVTPRAALLSALAAIGVIFIASPFAFQIFERPLIAIIPMFVVLIGYFARVRFPLGLPSGLVAVIIGAILAWTIPLAVGPRVMDFESVKASTHWIATSTDALHTPTLCWNEIVELLKSDRALLLSFLGVIVPMGLINAIGSLQNIESAEAAGDRFSTGPCMAVNGIGSIAAGLFGSCFPTTIYIGHPGWKALGARYWYSIINGVFFTAIFLLGLGAIVVSLVPMEAGIAIVMWIGVIITAQSYEAVPKRHYPAVAIAFFPAVAMMAVFVLPQILRGVGAEHGILQMMNLHGTALQTIHTDDWWPSGIFALAGANSGFIITCILISAISAFLIDRKFKTAGIWCIIAAAVTLMGFQHAYRVEPDPDPPHRITVSAQELLVWQRSEAAFEGTPLYLAKQPGAYWHRGYRIAAGYLAAALLLLLIHAMRERGKGFEDIAVDMHGGGGEPPDDEGELRFVPPTPKRAPPSVSRTPPASPAPPMGGTPAEPASPRNQTSVPTTTTPADRSTTATPSPKDQTSTTTTSADDTASSLRAAASPRRTPPGGAGTPSLMDAAVIGTVAATDDAVETAVEDHAATMPEDASAQAAEPSAEYVEARTDDTVTPAQDAEPLAPDAEAVAHEDAVATQAIETPAYDDAPPAQTDAPMAYDDAPAAYDETPAGQDVEPTAYDNAPAASGDEPTMFDTAPITQQDAQPAYDDAPAAYDDAPATYDDTPAMQDDAPLAQSDDAPAVQSDHVPATNDADASTLDAPQAETAEPFFTDNALPQTQDAETLAADESAQTETTETFANDEFPQAQDEASAVQDYEQALHDEALPASTVFEDFPTDETLPQGFDPSDIPDAETLEELPPDGLPLYGNGQQATAEPPPAEDAQPNWQNEPPPAEDAQPIDNTPSTEGAAPMDDALPMDQDDRREEDAPPSDQPDWPDAQPPQRGE